MNYNKSIIIIVAFMLTFRGYGSLLDHLVQPGSIGTGSLSLKVVKNESLKRSFLELMKTISKATIFIETGTGYGQTALEAAAVFPEGVYTVELSHDLYNQCQQTFKGIHNVHRYQGDSPSFLKKILSTIEGKTIFWLDAHYSRGVTARGEKETPIAEELSAIKQSGITGSVIMIDEMRLFYKEGSDYPTMTKLFELILAINPAYKMALLGDILIAFPPSVEVSVSPGMWAHMISRLYDENSDLPVDIKAIDSVIAQVASDEFEAVRNLQNQLSWDEQYGSCHGSYHWWYGLALLHREDFAQALNMIKVALISDAKKKRFKLLMHDIFAELHADASRFKADHKQFLKTEL